MSCIDASVRIVTKSPKGGASTYILHLSTGDEAVWVPSVLPAGRGGPGRPARRHQPAGPGQRRWALYSRHRRPLGQRPHAAGRQQFKTFCANCLFLKNKHLIMVLCHVFVTFLVLPKMGCNDIQVHGIFKLVRRPRIDSKESIPPAYVAWRVGTTTLFLLGSSPP
jgi:hypothetical protein